MVKSIRSFCDSAVKAYSKMRFRISPGRLRRVDDCEVCVVGLVSTCFRVERRGLFASPTCKSAWLCLRFVMMCFVRREFWRPRPFKGTSRYGRANSGSFQSCLRWVLAKTQTSTNQLLSQQQVDYGETCLGKSRPCCRLEHTEETYRNSGKI